MQYFRLNRNDNVQCLHFKTWPLRQDLEYGMSGNVSKYYVKFMWIIPVMITFMQLKINVWETTDLPIYRK